MNDAKATTKKAPETGVTTKKKRRPPPPRWPMYPESYVHARGRYSGFKSAERNA